MKLLRNSSCMRTYRLLLLRKEWSAFVGNNIKHLLVIIKYAMILGIVLLIINFLTPISNSLTDLLNRLAPPPTAEVISSRVIINSLRGIGKLVTVTSDPHFREVHVGVKQGIWIFEGIASYGANHEAEGIIEAGIDFTKVRGESLRCEETCTLIVPEPSITNCIIVRLRQTDKSRAIGGRDWELLEELGRYEAIRLFMEDVKGLGIIEEARNKAEVLLGEFVSTLVEKPVDIVFDDNETDQELPDTCVPEPPFGWEKDTDTGKWSRPE